MKLHFDVECTPEEARAFFGLPDVQPMQQALLKDVEERIRQAMQAADPEALFKTWFPAGAQGFEQLQKMFWAQMGAAGGGTKPK
jgi:hypothetical protein